ncbi:MAG: phosphatase PAP2 family protein, partial [Solirubrobacteraceae bacterium]
MEAATVVWLCWLYDAVTNLAPLRLAPALAHGRGILATEQSLGISPEHSLDRWLAAHHGLALAISDYYDNAHFVVTLGLLGLLWWRRADIYRPLRNALVLINVLAFAVFWLYPVAPPRMLGGFTDVVAASGAIGSWHTGALASAANQLAAMPSLHIAWAVWCTVAVWRMSPRPALRALAVLYPFLTGFAVLATGNHYV